MSERAVETNQNFKRAWILILLAALIGAALVYTLWPAPVNAPFISSASHSDPIPKNAAIEIRYIANEGVLISSRDKRVLIDGLHRKYADAYAYLPEAEQEKIETARPPFDKIDLVLVSHMHGDHFHPESVGRYLTASPNAVFASSGQVADLVASNYAGYASVKNRVTPIAYELKRREPMKLAGIDVDFLGVGHGSGRHASIQNLGHIFSVGGKKFLHIGDAEITDEIFSAFELEKDSVDIALLPYWFLTSRSGRELIARHIKPKHIVALHIGPSEAEQVTREVKQHFPDAHVFTTMLETRNF
jgi:L-ascorbate metabolism protein UlaG (beta-lactamase superfamily)